MAGHDPHRGEAEAAELDEGAGLVLEQHFAIVPEWVLFADISDAALRLYAVLLRYGQSSGQRMPSRAVLASRLRKRSKDSVDRALKELVRVGAVVVQRRRDGNRQPDQPLHRPQHAASSPSGTDGTSGAGGRRRTAEPPASRSRPARVAANLRPPRKRQEVAAIVRPPLAARDAATLAADLRPNPESLTQSKPPPPSPSASRPLVEEAGASRGRPGCWMGSGWRALTTSRRGAGPSGAGSACRSRGGRPAYSVRSCLTRCSIRAGRRPPRSRLCWRSPRTRRPVDPARLLVAGPWWDAAERADRQPSQGSADAGELAELEARLAEADGERVRVQRLAARAARRRRAACHATQRRPARRRPPPPQVPREPGMLTERRRRRPRPPARLEARPP